MRCFFANEQIEHVGTEGPKQAACLCKGITFSAVVKETAVWVVLQDAQIKELWEEHGGARGGAASIGADMGLSKGLVAKRLKAFGLKHGVLTDKQVVSPPDLLP